MTMAPQEAVLIAWGKSIGRLLQTYYAFADVISTIRGMQNSRCADNLYSKIDAACRLTVLLIVQI